MVQDDLSAPATKGDIQVLQANIQVILEAVHRNSQDIQDVKTIMLAQDEMLQNQIDGLATKEDLDTRIDGVLVTMEHNRLEILGSHKDRFTEHDKRIRKLEVHVGLAA